MRSNQRKIDKNILTNCHVPYTIESVFELSFLRQMLWNRGRGRLGNRAAFLFEKETECAEGVPCLAGLGCVVRFPHKEDGRSLF